ncbi:MAG: hypothetical protein QOE31_1263, partial [Solirubrobacteraceae bacterium]|nr:hypothetical protein [Solirubrobacteraceae bacterium]
FTIQSLDAALAADVTVVGDSLDHAATTDTDSLTIPAASAGSAWTFDGASGYVATAGLPDIFFGQIQRISGTTAVETLAGADASQSWSISAAGAVTIGETIFTGFEALYGGAFGDTLQGPASGQTWTISADGAGTLAGVRFSGFEVLAAGAGSDTLAGPVGGTDWTASGNAGAGTAAEMSFTGFETLTGGAGQDTLSGPNAATTWTITATAAGSVAGLAFTGIDVLRGGSAADTLQGPSAGATWTLSGPGAGTVAGLSFSGFDALAAAAAGSDVLNLAKISPAGTPLTLPPAGSGTYLATTYSSMETVSFVTAATLQFDGGSGDDTIVLRDIADTADGLQMEIVINGTATRFANPSQLLTIRGRGGDDTISIASLDGAFAAGLSIFGEGDVDMDGSADYGRFQRALLFGSGDSVAVTGSIHLLGGSLTVVSTSFSIAADVTLSTLATISGDVNVFAHEFSMKIANASPVFVDSNSASITLGDRSVITARNVALRAWAFDAITLGAVLPDELPNFTIKVLEALITALSALPVKVLVKEATATVTVGTGAQILATENIQVFAEADVKAAGKATSQLFSVGYTEATATATLTVAASALIQAGGAVDVFASATGAATMTSSTPRELGDAAIDKTQTALSIAVSNADVTSTATLAAGASIVAGLTANFRALGTIVSTASATAGNYSDGTAGIALGIQLSDATITTTVDGNITATAGPGSATKIAIDPTAAAGMGHIDMANYTIVVGPNALQTGDPVLYSSARGNAIGGPLLGLVSGLTYYVIRLKDNPATTDVDESELIQLASSKLRAYAGTAIKIGKELVSEDQSLLGLLVPLFGDLLDGGAIVPTVVRKSFVAADVDAAADTIRLPNPAATGSGYDFSLFGNTFKLGQPVRFNAPAGSSIAGLADGQIVYVIANTNEFDLEGDFRFVGKQTVRLARTEAEALAGIAIDLGAATGTGFQLTALHTFESELTSGVGVTGRLYASDAVSADAGLLHQDDLKELGKVTALKTLATKGIFDTILNALTKSYREKRLKGGSGAGTELGVAASLAYGDADHTVSTSVGTAAVLKSNNDLEVVARIRQREAASATAIIQPQVAPDPPGVGRLAKVGAFLTKVKHKLPGLGPNPAPPPSSKEYAVSVAIAIGLPTNTATTTIGAGAKLDALRSLRLFTELSYPMLTRLDNIPGSVGELTQALFVGTSGLQGLESNLGLGAELVNGSARASALADKVGVAGSVMVLVVSNRAETTLGSGVELNQNAAWRTATTNPHPNQGAKQLVSIVAQNNVQLIDFVGIASMQDFKAVTGVLADKNAPKQESGAGGSLLFVILDNTTKAIVGSDARIYAGRGLTVSAQEAIFHLSIGIAGGHGDRLAISGVFVYFGQTSNTLAQIQGGATITGASLKLYAGSLETIINVVGDAVSGKGIGVGAAAGVNDVLRTTRAVIGEADRALAPASAVDIDVTGDVTVLARTDGQIWAFTIAGVSVGNEPMGGDVVDPLDGSIVPSLNADGAKPPVKTGVGVAGAASVNLVDDTTEAYANALGRIAAGATLTVRAREQADIIAMTGAAVFEDAQGSAARNGVTGAIAGGFSINTITTVARALIIGTRLAAGAIVVEAQRAGDMITGTVGAASDKTPRGFAIAGSVSVDIIDSTTEAILRDAGGTATGSASVTARDEASIIAIGGALARGGNLGAGAALALNKITKRTIASIESSAHTLTGAHAAGVSSFTVSSTAGLSVGDAISLGDGSADAEALTISAITDATHFTTTTASTKAHTADAVRPSLIVGGGLTVDADNDADIIAVALSAGLGASAVFFTIAINLVSTSATAQISQMSVRANGGDVLVTATDSSEIDAGIGAVALLRIPAKPGDPAPPTSTSQAAIGLSIAVNVIHPASGSTIVAATIADSSVTASGAVRLLAKADGTIYIVAIAGSGIYSNTSSGPSGAKFAGAGVVTYNEISGDISALVARSTVASGSAQEISIKAEDRSSITADAGAVAISIVRGSTAGANISAGAAIAINDISRNVSAKSDGSKLSSGGAVTVGALSTAAIIVFALGIAGSVNTGSGGGTSFAGAGSGAGNSVDNDIVAWISGGSVTAGGALNVSATDETHIKADAGGVAVVGARGPPALAIGISVAANDITNIVRALIDGAATVTASDVDLLASSILTTIDALSFAGGGVFPSGSSTQAGFSFAGAGAGSRNLIRNTIEAKIAAGSVVTLTGAASVATLTAQDASTIISDAGGVGAILNLSSSGGLQIAVAGAVAINDIANTVSAIVDASTLTAPGGLTLSATSTATITALTFGVAAVVKGGGSSTNAAGSGAGASSDNTIANAIVAKITTSTVTTGVRTPTISGGPVSLTASDTSTVTATVFGAALTAAMTSGKSGTLAIGVSLARNRIANTIAAYVDGSTVTTAGGDVALTATNGGSITATSVAAAVAVAIGSDSLALSGGGAEGTNVILTTTDAYAKDSALGIVTETIGALAITATGTATIAAKIVAVSASVALSGGGNAAGVAIGVSVARNFIGWDPAKPPASTTYTTSSNPLTLSSGNTVLITSGPRQGDTYRYVGPTITGGATLFTLTGLTAAQLDDLAVADADDPLTTATNEATVDATADAALLTTLRARFTAAGRTLSANAKLSAPEPGGAWALHDGASVFAITLAAGVFTVSAAPIDLSTQDYADASRWTQVGMTAPGLRIAAYSKNTSVYASGALTLTATATQTIDATVAAGAMAIAASGKSSGTASGAGVSATNRIAADVRAYVDGDGTADAVTAASIAISASNRASISSIAAAASLAGSVGGQAGVAISIGISVATNTVDVDVDAYIANARVTTTTGGVTITATSGAPALFTHPATITGAQLDDVTTQDADDSATAADEAAADHTADATLLTTLEAALQTAFTSAGYALGTGFKLSLLTPGSAWLVVTAAGKAYVIKQVGANLEVSAATINAVSVAASLAVGLGTTGVALSGAGAVATNVVTGGTSAYVQDATISSAGAVSLTATGTSAIAATIVAASAAVGVGGTTGVGASIGAAVAHNYVGFDADGTIVPSAVQAYVKRAAITTTVGALTLSAGAAQTISALVISSSMAVGAGGNGAGLSGSGVLADNRIGVDVLAYIDTDAWGAIASGIAADAITLSATDRSSITATAGAASLAAAFGGANGLALSIGVSLARNEIHNSADAYIANVANSAATLNAKTGAITLTASANAAINALSFAASLAAGLGT